MIFMFILVIIDSIDKELVGFGINGTFFLLKYFHFYMIETIQITHYSFASAISIIFFFIGSKIKK